MRLSFYSLVACLVLAIIAPFSAGARSSAPVAPNDGGRWFYVQPPAVPYIWRNASSGYMSILADDILPSFAGQNVTSVSVWVVESGTTWMNPTGVRIDFHGAQCPPSMTADASYTVAYASCTATLVYSGSFIVYQVDVPLPGAYTLGSAASVAAMVIQNWGQNAPKVGLCMTGNNVVYGCGGAYYDFQIGGYPRWSPISSGGSAGPPGAPRDLAYALN
jgi:hypothetical protein